MQEIATINIESRENTGGGSSRRLRNNGYIPAVLYGKGMQPLPVKVKKSELRGTLLKYGKNAVFSIKLPGKDDTSAIIKEIQNDFATGEIMHADFHQISLTEEIKVEVPVKILGREIVEAARMVVLQQMDEISVKCLPQNAPQHIEIDVSKMSPGESIAAGDVKLLEGVALESQPDQIVVTLNEVKENKAEEENTEAEETETAAANE
ncbi:MAG TPA: 50S ribosomal protein L25 [Clostridiales bacterium]|nr:50S ribosomal protein L25 [Clostridiales bacterium]